MTGPIPRVAVGELPGKDRNVRPVTPQGEGVQLPRGANDGALHRDAVKPQGIVHGPHHADSLTADPRRNNQPGIAGPDKRGGAASRQRE
jgi:hypothetical protein